MAVEFDAPQPCAALLDRSGGPCKDFHTSCSSADVAVLGSLASLPFPSTENLGRRRAPCFNNHQLYVQGDFNAIRK
jgi:hypothetical protein